MEKKHQVHNLIILDESGSMESIKSTIISGFNELVQTIKGAEKQFPEQEHFISFVSFNSLGTKLLHFIDPAEKLNQINDKNYNPDALTPLYDAMGFAINKLKQYLNGQTDYNVLVTVLTDGAENASREFSGKDIKNLIDELKQNRWTFTYIGTDHDVEKAATTLSINNILVFKKSEAGIREAFMQEKKSRINYILNLKKNRDAVIEDYFNISKDNKTSDQDIDLLNI